MIIDDTADPGAEGSRVTDILAEFRDRLPAGRVTLRNAVDALGERAFGGFMLVLALPNILPLPLGATTILDIPMMLIAAQMMLGRRVLWLPDLVLRLGLPTERAARLIDQMLIRLRRAEALVRPRLPALTAPAAERPIGGLCLFLCLVLMLPVPLLGWFPAFALVALALGLVERDGVMLLTGLALSVLTVVATLAVVAGVAAASQGNLALPIDVPLVPGI